MICDMIGPVNGERRAGSPGYRLGVDIGGTFTDVVLLAGDGIGAHAQGALDPRRLRAGRRSTASARLLRRGGVGPRGDHRRRPCHHRRLEHDARGARRADGADHDRGLPRRARDAPAADPRDLRPPVREAAAARAARAGASRWRERIGPRRRRLAGARPATRSARPRQRSQRERGRGARDLRCCTRTRTRAHERAGRPRSSARCSATTSSSVARPTSSPRSASTSARAPPSSTRTSARRSAAYIALAAPRRFGRSGIDAPLEIMQSTGGTMRPRSPPASAGAISIESGPAAGVDRLRAARAARPARPT